MAYTINANAKNVWIRDNEDTRDLSIQTDASSVYLDNGRTLERELGEGSMVSNVATVDSAMSKVIDGTYDGAYESLVFKGKSLVNVIKNYTRSGYGSLSGSIALLDSGWIRATATSSNNHFELKMDNLNIKPSTKYMYILECRSNTFSGNGQTFQFGDTYKSHVDTPWTAPHIVRELPLGRYTFILTTKSDFSTLNNPVGDRSYICVGNGQIEFRYMILEYQEGMENWDIPFFTGLCDSKMPILRNTGKNLFDIEKTLSISGKHTVALEDGSLQFPQGSDRTYLTISGGTFKENTPYTVRYDKVSGQCKFYFIYTDDTEGEKVLNNSTSNPNKTLKYLRNDWSDGSTSIIKNIQIEEGSVTTTYEDHKTNILRTSEEIVLREVNGVQDTYNPLTGEYTKRIGEIVLDGSEGWGLSGFTNDNYFVAYCQATTNSAKANSKIKCDKIQYDSRVSVIDTICEGINIIGDKSLRISMSKSRVSNLSDFTSWLQSNPVTIQYELAEPVTTIVKPSTIPFAYQNGHVIVESGFEGQSLLPTLEYSTVVNRIGQVESVAKVVQKQEKQLTMLEQMLIQNIIGLDYNNTVLALNLEINEVM